MLSDNAEDRFFGGWDGTVYIRVKRKTTNENVSPLIKSTWRQRYGYGDYAPNGYAGCVAVAMGQIMRYHEYPASYDWDAMAYNYATDATAKFLWEIGTNVNMDYTADDGSSSNITYACKAFINNYGYGKSKIVAHTTAQTLGQLRKNRPLYMRGENTEEGHAWVCDGYKSSETTAYYELMAIDKSTFDHEKKPYYRVLYSCSKRINSTTTFHMNWGWGNSGGYYADSSTLNYTNSRQDIIDIYPTK